MSFTIGQGISLGSGISIGTIGGFPFTITYSQIVDPGDGTLTGNGFTGTYCIVELTLDQIATLDEAAGGSGWTFVLCNGTWSPGSVNTVPNDSDLVLSNTGTPGQYQLYGTLTGWPSPQTGPWNLPVTVTAAFAP